jgi:group I intron endonuclease
MKSFYGYIYKTINKKNNKIYIGKRKGVLDTNYFGSGIYLKRALNKYGKDKFKLEIIIYAENRNQLSKLEKQYIKKYRKMFGKENLYNITDGGDGFTGPRSEETKQKMRKPKSEEHKQNLSKALMNHQVTIETRLKIKKTLTGQKYSKERCKNMSESHKGIKLSEEHKRKIKIGSIGKNKGKKLSKLHCKKISDALKGRSLKQLGHKEMCQCCCCKLSRKN